MWVLGNEAWGLTADHAALLDRLVALPLYGRAESLNLSTAAAVLLYATRHRTAASAPGLTPRDRRRRTPEGVARGRSPSRRRRYAAARAARSS